MSTPNALGACPSALGKTYKKWQKTGKNRLYSVHEKYKGVKNMYLRQMEVVSQPEFIKGDIQEIIKSHKTIKKWAYILHDKDDTAPHYHIYLNFEVGVDSKIVAGWFGIEEQFISKVKGRRTDVLLYLTHGNDSQKNKHQYDPSEVIANFDFETEIKNAKILGDWENYSYAQQLSYVHTLPPSERTRAFRELRLLWQEQCQWLSLQTDRNIAVYFICGKGGVGKTYYAKKLLKKMNLDYCISSSSNDPFQDYLGQKAIILDDLRDRVFENFEDLLKILDNNTMSSVQSRFTNKVFNGEIIIITSSVPLVHWYRGKNSKGNPFNIAGEDLVQLYRRINCYVEITKTEIVTYNEIDNYGKPTGFGRCFKNELADVEKSEKTKKDYGSIFEEICEPADVVPFNEQMSIPKS